jgi:hypothetical protein
MTTEVMHNVRAVSKKKNADFSPFNSETFPSGKDVTESRERRPRAQRVCVLQFMETLGKGEVNLPCDTNIPYRVTLNSVWEFKLILLQLYP